VQVATLQHLGKRLAVASAPGRRFIDMKTQFGPAVALMTLMTWAVPALAQDCKAEITAMGSQAGPAQSDAERVARVYWRDAVSRAYGSAYADWDASRDTKMECLKQGEDAYLCWATATPCRAERLQIE